MTGRRILWITERHPPLTGGMAVSSGRQVTGLRRAGLDVDVLAFTDRQPRLTARVEAQDGGMDHHYSAVLKPGIVAQQAWRQVLAVHLGRPYSGVVGFGAARPGHLAVTYAAWLGLPAVVLVRGNDFDQDWFDPSRNGWVSHALARATVVGAVAPDLVGRIAALFPNQKVVFTPNGVDVAAWDLLPDDLETRDEIRRELGAPGRSIIGLFGELKHKKGLPYWLGALRDTGLTEQAALLIVGRLADEETAGILDDPQLAPPQRRYAFTGRDQLPGLYAACDYLAIPSLYDGLPNVLLEAMAVGVAPIVSDAGALVEVVENGRTGFVFRAGDRRDAARALAAALELDPAERALMGRRAREHVARNYSLERETATLIELIGTIGTQGG